MLKNHTDFSYLWAWISYSSYVDMFLFLLHILYLYLLLFICLYVSVHVHVICIFDILICIDTYLLKACTRFEGCGQTLCLTTSLYTSFEWACGVQSSFGKFVYLQQPDWISLVMNISSMKLHWRSLEALQTLGSGSGWLCTKERWVTLGWALEPES